MATAGNYRLRSEVKAGNYTHDAGSKFRVVLETLNLELYSFPLSFRLFRKAGLYSDHALTTAPRCFKNPDTSLTECTVFSTVRL